MSKQKKQDGLPPPSSWGYGYVFYENFPDQIIGKVLTLIEALGLPDKQEESVKSLVRQAIWNEVSDTGISITPERHTEIRNLHYEKKYGANIGGATPLGAI